MTTTQLTQTGELPDGILHNGQRHTTFVLLPPNVEHNLAALTEVGLRPDEAAANKELAQYTYNTRFGLAMLAQQLQQLGTIAKAQLTGTFLAANLTPADMDYLWNEDDALKKKRTSWPNASAPSTNSPPLPGSAPE